MKKNRERERKRERECERDEQINKSEDPFHKNKQRKNTK